MVSQRNGEEMKIDIAALRKEVLSFRVADGYTPKAKLASVDMLVQGMTLLMNSPILQQSFGASLPSMFAHMMALGGVKGIEEYAPERVSAPAAQPSITGQPSLPSLPAPDPMAAPAPNPAPMMPAPGSMPATSGMPPMLPQ